MTNSSRGIALISALVIMGVVLAFGVGAIFLAQSSLGLAGSQRAHLIAKNNANVGMEVAYAALKVAHGGGTTLPATLTMPTSPNAAITYQLVSYTPLQANAPRTQAQIVVLGTAPNGARFQTESMFEISTGTASTFAVGLVSERVVQVNGNIENLVNAQIHGNTGFSLGDTRANYQECDVNGTCLTLSRDDWPVTASPGATTCSVTSTYSGFCSGSVPVESRLVPPITVGQPPYDAVRSSVFSRPCSHNVSSISSVATSYTAGSVVCVAAGGDMDSRSYTGVTFIVTGSVTVKGTTTLTDSNILTTGDLLLEGNVTLTRSRLFADGYVWVKGNVYSSGSSTIASGSTLSSTSKWDGNAIRIEGNVIQNDTGTNVGLLMMAKGGIYKKGNLEGGSSSLLHAMVWAGDIAKIEGNVNLRGGINSFGRLEATGSVRLDGRADLNNVDLPTDRRVRTASRR
jgi:formylmethanofuran dehydrogenase subunit C